MGSEAPTEPPNGTANGAPEDRSGRTPWPRAAIVFAVLVRVVVGLHLFLADPSTRQLVSDAAYYDAWAHTLESGEIWEAGQPFWMPPLYPWLLGGLYTITGGAIAATLFVQALVGLASTLCFVALARRLVSARAAHVAAWLWVLYAPLVLFENRLLAVNAALPLVLGGLLCTVLTLERLERGARAPWTALVAGLCFGLACLARPNLLLGPLGLAIGGWFDLRRARTNGHGASETSASNAAASNTPRLAALALAALGALAPLGAGLAANLARSDEAVLVSANGGVNFWFGNNERARGTFTAPGIEWGDIFRQRDVARSGAAQALDVPESTLDAGAVSDHWFGRGLDWIANEPGAAAGLWLRKLAANLSSTEYGIQVVPSVVRESAPSLWLMPLPFGVVLALAVLSRGRGVRYRWALVGWIVAAQVAALAYFTYSRFRLPWYPALVPFAAAGVEALWLRRGTADAADGADGSTANRPVAARPGPVAWIAALAILAASYAPTEGSYPDALRSNACVDTALAWERRGVALVDAVRRQQRPRPDALASIDLTTRERRRAWLERALEITPGDAKALDELARLEWQEGDERSAAELLERALATGVDYPPARRRLALLRFDAIDGAVRDAARGREVLDTWLRAHAPDDYGALELGLVLAEHLLARRDTDDTAALRLRQVLDWLAPVHGDDPRLADLMARASS
ncbi:hypothetical protein Pla163_28450 [Planctomycetes bacterium Pla163]|uniref:Glycosyltransferase RgtA/B/C/D-like domain-containing protein n=1 Tax=Rohdeia mirabilis TaxID=2528008 RepID=A0A518D2K5_9BACT|nr:hypothetical protein Pla163_28450 [Planctomycetes bacterium Pla163]